MKFVYLFLFLILSFSLLGQSSRIQSFQLERTEQLEVIVKWTMSPGSTCQALEVQRQFPNGEFSTVYTYPSVCGNATEAISYTWIDEQVNSYSKHHYRLKLDEAEFSKVLQVDLLSQLKEKKIAAYPNPSNGEFRVAIRNVGQLNFSVYVFSQSGKLEYEKIGHKGFEADVKLSPLNSGMRYLKVEFENSEVLSIPIFIR